MVLKASFCENNSFCRQKCSNSQHSRAQGKDPTMHEHSSCHSVLASACRSERHASNSALRDLGGPKDADAYASTYFRLVSCPVSCQLRVDCRYCCDRARNAGHVFQMDSLNGTKVPLGA